ncbi:hypothetical protein ACFVZZ_37095 [Streptomyces chartreusis]|uniref:hypothetical protein n=1 Tax=Streptomyces chartreusis TaxID=1969 RepID=UPI0036DA5E16
MTPHADTIALAQRLIRCPSRAGIDDYGPVLGVLEDWLAGRGHPGHGGLRGPVCGAARRGRAGLS